MIHKIVYIILLFLYSKLIVDCYKEGKSKLASLYLFVSILLVIIGGVLW